MYDAWLANIDALRAELGNDSAEDLVDEANTVQPNPGATRGGAVRDGEAGIVIAACAVSRQQ
jgi:hypothetical protein